MKLESQVNSSGFPLQMAIANRFRQGDGRWKVLYEEHEWNGEEFSGFIDLVLEDCNKTWLMTVECKRVKDATWIFLRDKKSEANQQTAKLWVSKKTSEDKLQQFDWVDVPMNPTCFQSSFCVVPGQDAKSRPMLERVASLLVMSTEALAKEEAVHQSYRYSDLRIYQNVIVTTANLSVCSINVDDIDLANGELGHDSKFVEVPYVRFRKQLGASLSDCSRATYDRDVNGYVTAKESTVFVVNSEHFEEFIIACDLPDNIGRYVGGR